MVYDTTNLSNSNTLVDIFSSVNQLTGNALSFLIIAIIMLIVFASLSIRYGSSSALVVSSFFGFITSLMLFFSGLVQEIAIIITFSLMLVTIFAKVFID